MGGSPLTGFVMRRFVFTEVNDARVRLSASSKKDLNHY